MYRFCTLATRQLTRGSALRQQQTIRNSIRLNSGIPSKDYSKDYVKDYLKDQKTVVKPKRNVNVEIDDLKDRMSELTKIVQSIPKNVEKINVSNTSSTTLKPSWMKDVSGCVLSQAQKMKLLIQENINRESNVNSDIVKLVFTGLFFLMLLTLAFGIDGILLD